MAIPFVCPKCGQKMTLTASKPGDWIDCPACEATVQIPGAAPPPKPPPRPTAAPAPKPARRPAPAPLDEDEPQSVWADKRVQVGAIAGGIGLLMVGLLVVALAVQKPKKAPEMVQNEPPAVQPQPKLVTPSAPAPTPVEPKERPKDPEEPSTLKIELLPKPKDPEPKPKDSDAPAIVVLDQFGNPVGQNVGLARQDEFKGQRLLFWSPHTGAGDMFYAPKNPLWKAWEDKGFVVRKEFGRFKAEWLDETDQLWILSTADEATLVSQRKLVPDLNARRRELLATINSLPADRREEVRKQIGAKFPKGKLEDIIELDIGDTGLTISPAFRLSESDYKAIVAFAKAGKGLCLLSDNDPFTYESNELARRLFPGVRVQGNYQGEKIAYVRRPQLTDEQIKKYRGDYEVPDHPLLTGVNFVYEGITISHPSASNKLDVALRASDGEPVIAVSKEPGLRVIIDCGFTRYCHGPNDDVSFILMTAGTPRLAQNMAAYLAGKTEVKKP